MRKWCSFMVWPLLAAACSGGCGGGDGKKAPPEPPTPSCETATTKVNVVTWNVALGPGMNPQTTPRIPHVAEALRNLEFDVLCLQELWSDEGVAAVVDALGLPSQNVLAPDTAGKGENGTDKCEPEVISAVADCARAACAGLTDEEVTQCTADNCRTELVPVALGDRGCLNCLIATAGRNADDVERICSTTGASRIQGGNTGLLLASRWPLKNTEVLLVPASNANRAGIYATIAVPGMAAPIEVGCTHLAASSRDLEPYHSGAETWYDEKLVELNQVSHRLSSRAGSRTQILAGDLNIAPIHGTNNARDDEDLWQRVLDVGFTPMPLSIGPGCTSCEGNTFRQGEGNWINDHVLVRDPRGGTTLTAGCGARLFDQTVDIAGYRGEPLTTHLSDHYGVSLTFVADEPAK